MLSPTSDAYQHIEDCTQELFEGVVIAIDPSIGSNSSMPGWAVYRAGQLVTSGTFQLITGGDLPGRLRSLSGRVHDLYGQWDPDVLVYEEIPAQRHGGSAASHSSLLKAVGAILAVPGPSYFVPIYPISWKKMVRSTYVKSDENDAVEIGWIVIEEAKRIRALQAKKKK